jgi:hypothetical protein
VRERAQSRRSAAATYDAYTPMLPTNGSLAARSEKCMLAYAETRKTKSAAAPSLTHRHPSPLATLRAFLGDARPSGSLDGSSPAL